jgi:hypothetical protein
VSVPLAHELDAPAQASRFLRAHASHHGLSDEGTERFAAVVAETLFRIAGHGLTPRTFAMSNVEDQVNLVVEFDGSGGVRLEDRSTAEIAALADRWGWEETCGCWPA